MRQTYTITMDGADATLAALRDAQPELKKATQPELKAIAQDIRKRARAGVQRHPSGLWRGLAGASYRTQAKGEFWYQVYTPGSPVGRAEAIRECARRGWTTQGAALVRGLDMYYDRASGGRILWKARDDMDGEIAERIQRAVDEAAAKIEKEASTVG